MTIGDLLVFLTAYTLTVAFAAVAEAMRRRDALFWITVIVALGALAATTIRGFYVEPPTRYIEILWFLFSHRDISAFVSLGMGVAAGLVWVARLVSGGENSQGVGGPSIARRSAEQLFLAASICGVVLGGEAFIWKNLTGFTGDFPTSVEAPGFVIEKVANLDYHPLRVAVRDDGTVYVSYDYFEKYGAIGGAIIELSQDSASPVFQQKIIVESPFLMRPYGLAVRKGDLYVSRSGFFPSAAMGKVSYASTGAVTQLRDLDGDGYFEFMHDIVTGLPGIRGPDTMHQNNAICFAPDGSLFVTCAAAADRAPDEHPWGGVILQVSPDFTRTEVYAQGFRNPWGMAIGPDGELFATDNDVDENPGDKITHVVEGAHFGHPYVIPDEAGVQPSGFDEPIYLGDIESNLLGIAYTDSPALPEEYRSCLYVTDLLKNEILRLTLEQVGKTYKVTGAYPFASIPSPVDIAITPSGEFFVLSRRMKRVYRIRPEKAAAVANEDGDERGQP